MSDTEGPLIPDRGLSRRDFLRLTGVATAGFALGAPVGASAARPAAPRRGGALRLGNTADVVTFEPYVPSDNVSIWTMLLLYDQLVRPTTDGLNIVPSLAASWDISPDKTIYTFHLRSDVRFHDGSPLTAEDVVFCLEHAIASPGGSYFFSAVKHVAAIGRHNVRVALHHPHAPFLADMALYNVSIYPKRLRLEMGKKFWEHPVGSGPFKFQAWHRGSELVFARNPHFWRNRAQPYVNTFHNMVVPDTNARVLQVQSGELDIALFAPPSQARALHGNPNVTVHVDNFMDSHFAPLNVTKPPLTDRRVRQALNYGIDKQEIVRKILFGFGTPSGQALPFMFGYNPSVKPYPYDVSKAKTLLKQAGYPHGFPLKLLVDASQDVDKEVATLMQEEYDKIGVKLSIQVIEEASLNNIIENKPHNYQMTLSYMTSDIIDPDELTSFAVAGNAGTDAIWTMYNNKTVDRLAKTGAQVSSRAQRRHLYYEMERLHHDDAPMVFLYRAPSLTISTSKVQGFKVLPTGNYRLEEVWLK